MPCLNGEGESTSYEKVNCAHDSFCRPVNYDSRFYQTFERFSVLVGSPGRNLGTDLPFLRPLAGNLVAAMRIVISASLSGRLFLGPPLHIVCLCFVGTCTRLFSSTIGSSISANTARLGLALQCLSPTHRTFGSLEKVSRKSATI